MPVDPDVTAAAEAEMIVIVVDVGLKNMDLQPEQIIESSLKICRPVSLGRFVSVHKKLIHYPCFRGFY
jgi:hypothetical protein